MRDSAVLKPWLAALNAQRQRVFIGFCLMLMTAGAGVVLLGMSAWFISAAAVFVVAFDIFVPGAAIRTLALLRTVSRYAERVYNHDLILRLQQRWRIKLFQGLVKQPLQVSEKFRLAHVLQRLTQDLNALDDLYIRVLAPFLLVTLSAGLVGLGFFLLSPALAFFVWGAVAFLLTLHALILAPQLKRFAAAELEASEGLRQASLAFVESKAELHAWQVLPQALHSLNQHRAALQRQQSYLRRRLTLLQAIVELWALLSVLIVLALALQAAMSGAFSIPLALLCGLAVLAMLDQWLLLPQASLLWGRIVGAAQRLQPMLSAGQLSMLTKDPTQVGSSKAAGQGRTPCTGAAPDLRLENIEVSTRNLAGRFNVQIAGGQVTVISGASGAGKSTLLMFLAGVLPATHGTLYVAGQAASQPLLALDAALLTQHNAILAQSVAVNLRLASTEVSDDKLWDMLERVELADTIEQLPQQLDTWLGDGGVQLSGGQQRRLALARTFLYAEPRDLLLLDEPFNGVGDAQAKRIWTRLLPLCESKTVIIASHQASPFDSHQQTHEVVQQAIESCYNSAP